MTRTESRRLAQAGTAAGRATGEPFGSPAWTGAYQAVLDAAGYSHLIAPGTSEADLTHEQRRPK